MMYSYCPKKSSFEVTDGEFKNNAFFPKAFYNKHVSNL